MRSVLAWLLAGMVVAAAHVAIAQDSNMTVPASVTAGSAFTIPTAGNGKAAIYIVGPAQALRRDVQLGQAASFDAGDLYNAGRYLAILVTGSSTTAREFDVVPAVQPEALSFLAKPSRLPVGLHNGISGAAYVFDAYHNLITTPIPVSFELSNQGSTVQAQTVTTRNGVAWTEMNSAEKQGSAKFLARVGDVSSTRVIQEVPGNPCGLTMSARPDGQRVELQTTPVKDCSGNPVPDGTIVTFTENYDGMQSTVDAPLKQGIAQAEMPSYKGATISVASGVVAGNEIRWEGGR
ncbi:MAG TPA: hypothetical protein VMF56_02955 [Acidobacteriaceae bacterium]|nr:hypothetical protein [Acidobacteriaceae bacterium]